MFLSTAAGAGSMITLFLPLVVFFLLMYFMVMRPQKKEQQRVKSMLAAMEVGDSVVTTSGFYGIIIDITDEDVIVEFGNNRNCRLPMRNIRNWRMFTLVRPALRYLEKLRFHR